MFPGALHYLDSPSRQRLRLCISAAASLGCHPKCQLEGSLEDLMSPQRHLRAPVLIDATKQLSSLDGRKWTKGGCSLAFCLHFDRAVMGKSRSLRRCRRGAPSMPIQATSLSLLRVSLRFLQVSRSSCLIAGLARTVVPTVTIDSPPLRSLGRTPAAPRRAVGRPRPAGHCSTRTLTILGSAVDNRPSPMLQPTGELLPIDSVRLLS